MNWKTYAGWRAARRRVRELTALLFFAPLLLAQQGGGYIEGFVRDQSHAAIAGAQVIVQNESTGTRQKLSTDASGHYESDELAPGPYRIAVRSESFRAAAVYDIAVRPGESCQADFAMILLPVTEEITVQSRADPDNPAANGITATRESSSTALPMNGRDLHSLYSLLPGAVLTPAASSDGGQFSVLGMRANANSFRVDGVSGNTGISIAVVPGAFPGATLPGMTVIGSTQDLAANDEIERVEMRSPDFAPEYGDRPGAQVLIETRSGANGLHGAAFGYWRPQSIDSPDWFAGYYGAPLKPATLDGYGASLGGALWPDRTFFFAAIERASVDDKALEIMPTPSIAARNAAPLPYRAMLDAFPAPSGPQLTSYLDQADVALEKAANVQTYSLRIDQAIGSKARLFARFADAPSRSSTSYLGNTRVTFGSISGTLGATFEAGGWIHDLRFNFSRAKADGEIDLPSGTQTFFEQAQLLGYGSSSSEDNLLQTIPIGTGPTLQTQLPALGRSNLVAVSIAGVGQMLSWSGTSSHQTQWEGRYTVARQWAKHDLRAGADFVDILPGVGAELAPPTVSIVASDITQVVGGDPLGITLSSGNIPGIGGRVPIGAIFLQDNYKPSDRLSLLYGVRWELTPPSDTAYNTVYSFGPWSGPGTAFTALPVSPPVNDAPWGHSTWPTRYSQIAPRLGLAYHLSAPDLTLRAGGGLFYDDALGSLLDPVNLSPLNSWQFLPGMTAPSSAGDTAHRIATLFLPKVWEWEASVERPVGKKSTLSLSYVGSSGTHLLREEATLLPDSEILNSIAFASSGISSYNGLEAQFRGDISPRLFGLISYTWSHSIDNGSQEGAVFATGPGLGRSTDRGSSSFDIRRNLSASGVWRPHLLKGLVLSGSAEVRTGFPFDVTTVDRSIGLGFANTGRPDLVPGVPLWLANPKVPGGRELNSAAFRLPADGTDGDFGRNVLTGPGLFQFDASLRRQFRLGGASTLEWSISAFNLFNTANFANPTGYLGSPLFGLPPSMQNLMLGSGTPNAGLTPLFQSGGPRTAELSLKFTF